MKQLVQDEGMLKAKVYTFEEMLQNKGYLAYTNVGSSMMPFLRERCDIIEIRPIATRCKKYDVVLYRCGEMYILHRILKVLPEGYIIAGDHNTFVETGIQDKDILGVMTQVIRNGRTITPENKWYRLYVHLWCDAYPVRMMILRGKARIYNALRRLKRYLS